MTRRTIITFLAALTTTSACQRHIPETTPTPKTTDATFPSSLSREHTNRWSITATDEKLDYRSTRTVALVQTPTPLQRRDSFTTTIDFSITSKHNPSATSYTVQIRSIHSREDQVALQVPFSFSGRLINSKFMIDALNGAPLSPIINCNTGQLFFAAVATQLMITVPAQMETGTTWTDSLSTTACAGSVPGVLSITRAYRILGSTEINGLNALILQLDEKTTLTGEGSQERHRVQVQGTGSGKGQLILDATTGAILSAITDRLTLLTVTASGRDQRFQQHVNETLVRVQ